MTDIESEDVLSPDHNDGFQNNARRQKEPTRAGFAQCPTDWIQPRLTAKELAMMNYMAKFSRKPNWHDEIHSRDPETAHRLRRAAARSHLMTPLAWQWCAQELRGKAAVYEATGMVQLFDGASCLCRSDAMIESTVMADLQAAARQVFPILEQLDQHQPLHRVFIDPNHHPLVFGHTRILKNDAHFKLYDEDTVGSDASSAPCADDPSSNSIHLPTQWLPFEVTVASRPGNHLPDAKISSYINGVHPYEGKALYRAIEAVLPHAIASWNQVLLRKGQPRKPPRILTYGPTWDPPLPPPWVFELGKAESDPKSDEYRAARHRVEEYVAGTISAKEIDRLGLFAAADARYRQLRKWMHPEAGISFSYDDWIKGNASKPLILPKQHLNGNGPHEFYNVKLEELFATEGLQVIAELEEILLPPTPQNIRPNSAFFYRAPAHRQGGSNLEHIVATSVLYFDSENMNAESGNMTFAVQAGLNGNEQVYDPDNLEPLKIYDYKRPDRLSERSCKENLLLQDIGTVNLADGELLSYPGVLLHSTGFSRAKIGKQPARRRILKLHLVDPYHRIPSTRNVPPQQASWWIDAVRRRARLETRLPVEIVDMILAYATAHATPDTASSAADTCEREHRQFQWTMDRVGELDEHLGWDFGPQWRERPPVAWRHSSLYEYDELNVY